MRIGIDEAEFKRILRKKARIEKRKREKGELDKAEANEDELDVEESDFGEFHKGIFADDEFEYKFDTGEVYEDEDFDEDIFADDEFEYEFDTGEVDEDEDEDDEDEELTEMEQFICDAYENATEVYRVDYRQVKREVAQIRRNLVGSVMLLYQIDNYMQNVGCGSCGCVSEDMVAITGVMEYPLDELQCQVNVYVRCMYDDDYPSYFYVTDVKLIMYE